MDEFGGAGVSPAISVAAPMRKIAGKMPALRRNTGGCLFDNPWIDKPGTYAL
jgi:hypothetical protein